MDKDEIIKQLRDEKRFVKRTIKQISTQKQKLLRKQ